MHIIHTLKSYISGGGAWTAGTPNNEQRLGVDLGYRHVITAVATQGRRGSLEYVTEFYLEFSSDNKTWSVYTNEFGTPLVNINATRFIIIINTQFLQNRCIFISRNSKLSTSKFLRKIWKKCLPCTIYILIFNHTILCNKTVLKELSLRKCLSNCQKKWNTNHKVDIVAISSKVIKKQSLPQ